MLVPPLLGLAQPGRDPCRVAGADLGASDGDVLRLGASGLEFERVERVAARATQGCFNCTSTLECLSDHKGVKKEASTFRDLEER